MQQFLVDKHDHDCKTETYDHITSKDQHFDDDTHTVSCVG